jgi:hypothetical protein
MAKLIPVNDAAPSGYLERKERAIDAPRPRPMRCVCDGLDEVVVSSVWRSDVSEDIVGFWLSAGDKGKSGIMSV